MNFEFSEQNLTLEELNQFESYFKLILPKSYKITIYKSNGGYPEKEYFRGGGVYFLPIKYGDYPLEEVLKVMVDVLPNNFLPFAEYGGTFYCISLNNDENYGKIYWITEDGASELVCNSFEEFMNELSDNEDY